MVGAAAAAAAAAAGGPISAAGPGVTAAGAKRRRRRLLVVNVTNGLDEFVVLNVTPDTTTADVVHKVRHCARLWTAL